MLTDLDRSRAIEALGGLEVVVGETTITAIYRRPYAEAGGVESYSPSLICRTSDVADVDQGTAVTIGDDSFVVVERQPRDDGMTRLMLEACDPPEEPEEPGGEA